MSSIINKIKEEQKKRTKEKARENYAVYYETLPIDEKTILFESQHGQECSGNVFYMLKYISSSPKYKGYKLFITSKIKNHEKTKAFLEEHKINNVTVVILGTDEYYKVVATAKYLINDNTFLPFFVKKEGQIYINTWHGTPLKTLGKKIKNDFHRIGNTQRNFVHADYLLYPNEFTRDRMIEDYVIADITNASAVLSGYPRNVAFFDDKRRKKIRKECEFEGKRVYMYMPTWRGVVGNSDTKANVYLQYFLFEIDKKLADDEIMYVNLHPVAKKSFKFKEFKNIKEFPKEYETYEFLNAGNCLITDYSSVMFDYAVTGRKIINFTYDRDEYLADRGLYIELDELPFPKVENTESLLNELRTPKNYNDEEFLNTFCPYDNKNAAADLCDHFILNENRNLNIQKIEGNGKDNVLVFVGNLAKNGITSSVKNLFRYLDTSKKNYYITFMAASVEKYKDTILEFPENVRYISMLGAMNMNTKEKHLYNSYHKKEKNTNAFLRKMNTAYNREVKRLFGDIEFSDMVHFTGYEYLRIILFSHFKCNKIIYVHSDMMSEIKTRNNARASVLKYAYNNYDKIALVTEDLKPLTAYFTNNDTSNFHIANNIIDYKNVLKKSKKKLKLDEDTTLNVEPEKLTEVLDSDAKKFITIGRYSPEKGHERLLASFNRVWLEDNNTYLIIIGGHGNNYENLCETAESMECKDNVIFIRSMSNPYTVLNKCDYFVLSSYYEGFGLVLAEADILGLPVISTDITGPRCFMEEHGGTLVENNEQGLYDGMKMLLADKIKPMNVDYEKYNQNAIKQFENLLN